MGTNRERYNCEIRHARWGGIGGDGGTRARESQVAT